MTAYSTLLNSIGQKKYLSKKRENNDRRQYSMRSPRSFRNGMEPPGGSWKLQKG